MSKTRWLFFALGMAALVSIGAGGSRIATPLLTNGVALSDVGITFPDGTTQTTAANHDLTTIFFSADQTVGVGSQFLGQGFLSNTFDDVAQVVPEDGRFTQLSFSIKQRISAGVPSGPGIGESVAAYLVIVPFDDVSLDYGTPRVTAAAVEQFLDGGAVDDGTFVPLGTRVELATLLDDASGHLARTSVDNAAEAPAARAGDLVAAWVRPDGFSSFQPAVTLTFAVER